MASKVFLTFTVLFFGSLAIAQDKTNEEVFNKPITKVFELQDNDFFVLQFSKSMHKLSAEQIAQLREGISERRKTGKIESVMIIAAADSELPKLGDKITSVVDEKGTELAKQRAAELKANLKQLQVGEIKLYTLGKSSPWFQQLLDMKGVELERTLKSSSEDGQRLKKMQQVFEQKMGPMNAIVIVRHTKEEADE